MRRTRNRINDVAGILVAIVVLLSSSLIVEYVVPSKTQVKLEPRLLAVNDVHLTAPTGATEPICRFYEELLGFKRLPETAEDCVSFVGLPRSGPRLIVEFLEAPPGKPMRRQALVQFASLTPVALVLTEQGVAFEWSSGWFFFDKRIGLLDPAGNWIELASSHAW